MNRDQDPDNETPATGNWNQAIVYLNRGSARYTQGDLDAAIADYDQAIALFPGGSDKATAFNNRGNARKAQSDLDAAIADYDQAIAHDPNNANAFNNRGNVRKAQGDLDAAIADYDQAIALFPDGTDKATAYINRGLAHRDQGDLDAAAADYDLAVALDPDYVDALLGGGRVRSGQEVPDAHVADDLEKIVGSLGPQGALTAFPGDWFYDPLVYTNLPGSYRRSPPENPESQIDNVGLNDRSGETDKDILRRLQAGDELAWDQLLAEWQGPLYQHLCYSLPTPEDAAEVLQGVMEALVVDVKDFDGKVALSKFIYEIAARKISDFFGSKRKPIGGDL